MSIALTQQEKPAPPIRRTPSISTNTQHVNNHLIKTHLKPTQESIEFTQADDFPPPPEFLLSNEPTKPAVSPSVPPHSSLLAEIQRGGFKLRKTAIDRDRSAPRLK